MNDIDIIHACTYIHDETTRQNVLRFYETEKIQTVLSKLMSEHPTPGPLTLDGCYLAAYVIVLQCALYDTFYSTLASNTGENETKQAFAEVRASLEHLMEKK